MAKFNKDTFIKVITGKVQSAINKRLISNEDIENDDLERLHGFIQYELTEYIEDRKFALDVLSDFNYDDKIPWSKLEETFGKFKTLMDIALVNLWKFLENEGATEYSYYKRPDDDEDELMLDVARKDGDKFDDNQYFQNGDEDLEADIDRIYDKDDDRHHEDDEEGEDEPHKRPKRINFHHDDEDEE